VKIIMDTREKTCAVGKILREFEKQGIEVIRHKLDVGDYMVDGDNSISIDRKQNLTEITCNVTSDHERFKAEMLRATKNGTKLIILCEHGPTMACLEDVKGWKNPRLKYNPKATTGEQLHKILLTISSRYDVDILFCNKAQTGRRILELLGVQNE